MRNYWALLPAIAVSVVLILLYAVPTLINPQWTTNVLGLFKQHPEDTERADLRLSERRVRSRRMLAGLLVAVALALVGFNISLNREANGCYQAAKAWGATDDHDRVDDPCVNMIYGTFIGDGEGELTASDPQPVPAYQLVRDKRPKYLNWIQNRPSYDKADLLIGLGVDCASDLRVVQGKDKITVAVDDSAPCPPPDSISLTSIKLTEPLGDRPIVTVGGKPMREITADMDSWPTVLKKLVTGG
ncbi:hypothetical protein [Kribbella flavida]|uniref:hypothetical protein n=1 Tax=Kribbella flavida TaxID=182640 RepID=UPI00019BD9E6|nr:hypothetical protein [Kribbella flavida]